MSSKRQNFPFCDKFTDGQLTVEALAICDDCQSPCPNELRRRHGTVDPICEQRPVNGLTELEQVVADMEHDNRLKLTIKNRLYESVLSICQEFNLTYVNNKTHGFTIKNAKGEIVTYIAI